MARDRGKGYTMAKRGLAAVLSMASLVVLTLMAPRPAMATFPGGDGRIAFDDYVNEQHVFVINADGTGLTDLTPGLLDNASQPSWSPDGSRIVFARDFPRGIWVMNADGSGMTQLTFGTDEGPAYSPDGGMIAYSHFESPGGIVLMSTDGTYLRRLTSRIYDSAPDWSPDGGKIAFVRNFNQIYVVNVDGTGGAALTRGGGATNPSWSPDGTKITFERYDAIRYRTDVWVVNADGSGQVNLTGRLTRTFYGNPAWSPDGTEIVVTRRDDCGGNGIAIIAADGRGETGLYCNYDARNPAWQSR
jgi:Tol biopolymer transport system component